ncbi:hypothetical protein IO200_004553 [Salmonella enterica]|nr:hypothetical protein [Salmonella enterica]EHX0171517.1 hypothetical protein [Salmonella enterica]EIJ1449545.1 hypothetical protein [Salmonella enterica]EIT1311236.1 hypothetical protein [Salmonella enterica]
MPTTETKPIIKHCRKCGEPTERHPTSKRCMRCKKRLDAEAWEKRKAAIQADPEKLAAYRAATRERMNKLNAERRAAYVALPASERMRIDNEKAAAARAKARYW